MEITYIDTANFKELKKYDIHQFLIIESDKITKSEKEFFKTNNILYRLKNSKVEIFLFSFLIHFVEYCSDIEEGIYFSKTKEFYNFYKENYYINEMSDEEKNLIICKEGMKIEILLELNEFVIQKHNKIFEKYFIDKDILELKNDREEKTKKISEIIFENIIVEKVIYKRNLLSVKYKHINYSKKLNLKNVKSCRICDTGIPYSTSLVKKIEEGKILCNFINKAPKYNEVYLLDASFRRIMIKFQNKNF